MQNVSFRSVDEFLDFIPPVELKMVVPLRRLVLESVPGITEKLSYNVPFYRRHKGLFFIWPASVLWGKYQTFKGVRFGFQQGNLLSDEEGYLDRGSRKQVFWKNFTSLSQIEPERLKMYIYEAALIDEQFAKGK
jgi:hypothetical protein